MKVSLALAAVVTCVAAAVAQEPPPVPVADPAKGPVKEAEANHFPSPMLGMARRSPTTATLDIQRMVPGRRSVSYTSTEPVTVSEFVDGERRDRVEFVERRRTRSEPYNRAVIDAVAIDRIEVRSAGGKVYKADELADLFQDEFRAVVLLPQPIGPDVKPSELDPNYLAMLKPDTLIVIAPFSISSTARGSTARELPGVVDRAVPEGFPDGGRRARGGVRGVVETEAEREARRAAVTEALERARAEAAKAAGEAPSKGP